MTDIAIPTSIEVLVEKTARWSWRLTPKFVYESDQDNIYQPQPRPFLVYGTEERAEAASRRYIKRQRKYFRELQDLTQKSYTICENL